jgi:hypothetical protein
MIATWKTVSKIGMTLILIGCQSTTNVFAVSVHKFNDVEFRMDSCEITQDRSAICKLKITNLYRDKKIGIDRRITIQDEHGNDYPVTKGGFGDASVSRAQWFQVALADSSYQLVVIATNLSTKAKSIRAVIFKRLGVLTPQGQTIGFRDDVIFAKPVMVSSITGSGQSSQSPNMTNEMFKGDEWHIVGYWDYDGVDGQQLTNGLVLRIAPGSGLGQKWKAHLELKNHGTLATRKRTLWPVKINTYQRKVCANYPNYPSYQANIDMPGQEFDGIYSFSECDGGR